MARLKKEIKDFVNDSKVDEPKDYFNVLKDLEERVAFLEKVLHAIQPCLLDLEIDVLDIKKSLEKPKGESINRVEKFNDEVPSTIESYNGMRMEASDKIISMQNAIKILPPNMVVNGRHLKENVEAICGFKVLDEMMDEAYEGIVHDEFIRN